MPELIPLSKALAEASPESLRELLERDAYGLTLETLKRQVAAIREYRERVSKGEFKASKQKKETKKADAPATRSEESAGDLGF
jgi:hypothetical protein